MDRVEKMWKRIPRASKIPTKDKERTQVIGSPVFLDSSVDRQVLQRMPDITDSRISPSPNMSHSPHTISRIHHPSESPSPDAFYQNEDWNQSRSRPPIASSYYGDVSPPDSPQMAYKNSNSGDVSPIEPDESDIHPAFRNHTIRKKISTTNIPIPRREISASKIPTPASRAYTRDPTKPVKWDKYTGEPTTSDKGLSHGVKPEAVITGIEKSRLRPVNNPHPPRTASKGLNIDVRPQWKGASGRHAIVDPVADHPERKAPLVPNRDMKSPIKSGIPTPPHSSSPIVPRRELPRSAETGNTPAIYPRPSRETIRPIGSPDSNPGKPSEASSSSYPSPPFEEDVSPPGTSATMRRIPTGAEAFQSQASTPDKAETFSSHKKSDSRGTSNPNSRFSWTTQATNTTYQQSPPPSPPPPVPAIDRDAISQVPSDSIMNRKRPVPSARNHSPEPQSPVPSVSTRRKPLALSPNPASNATRPSSRAPSIMSTATASGSGKALPATPQELASTDHIGTMTAQMEDLALQRNNISRILRDLTRPEASNPLTTSFLAEREREKRVQALQNELAAIQAVEHDLGLQLYRAHRRREREEGNEGFTTLWVRRVTG